jgi:hypothetical protein
MLACLYLKVGGAQKLLRNTFVLSPCDTLLLILLAIFVHIISRVLLTPDPLPGEVCSTTVILFHAASLLHVIPATFICFNSFVATLRPGNGVVVAALVYMLVTCHRLKSYEKAIHITSSQLVRRQITA